MHRMCDARATSPVSSGPEPHDPPAILVEWSGPGTVPVSDLHSVARSGSGPVAGHGARAPHGVVIVRRRGRRAQRVDSGSCTPSQRASARAERRRSRPRSRPRRVPRSTPPVARHPSFHRRVDTDLAVPRQPRLIAAARLRRRSRPGVRKWRVEYLLRTTCRDTRCDTGWQARGDTPWKNVRRTRRESKCYGLPLRASWKAPRAPSRREALAMELANETVRSWINADLDRMAESYGDEEPAERTLHHREKPYVRTPPVVA